MISRVRKGERFQLYASDWNRIAENAEYIDKIRRGQTDQGGPRSLGDTRVLVHNPTNDPAVDWDLYDCVSLTQLRILKADNEDGFFNQKAFIGGVPDAAVGTRFGILLEPLRGDDVGVALIAGVTYSEIEIASESDLFAVPIAGQRKLRSAASGPVAILARNPTASGKAWALIRLGGGGGGGAAGIAYAMITVRAGSSPPYRYTAAGATMDVNGAWTGGGATYENVFNLEEQGTGGQWVNGLNVGDVVSISPAPGGSAAFVCQRAHYRGTY